MNEQELQEKMASISRLSASGTKDELEAEKLELQRVFDACTGDISARMRFDVCSLLIDLDPYAYFPHLQRAAHDLLRDPAHPPDDVTLVQLHDSFDMGTEWMHAEQAEEDVNLQRDMAMREGLQFRALGAARRILKCRKDQSPRAVYDARAIICSSSDDAEEILGVLTDAREEGNEMDYLCLARRTLGNDAFPVSERVFIAHRILSADFPPALRSGMLTTVIGFTCSAVVPAIDRDEAVEKELGITVSDVIGYVESLFAELAQLPDEEQNRALALAILCRFYANLGDRTRAEERYASLRQLRTTIGGIHFYSEEVDRDLRDSIDRIGF
ncbi:MAG: hypothetical protein PHX93_05120 [Candidatus Peribacteraceae bacterium]|jgi:hypothetical protein|nr:hypothetical protein [Candidatus Peribacteraceae bacterium]